MGPGVSGASAIEWTEATWNPVTGCDRVSPGCAHCYALDYAARLKAMGQQKYQRDGDPRTSGPGFGVTLHPDELEAPLRRRKPTMYFVNSMSDLFHELVPDEFIDRVVAVMSWAQGHTFQVLTKRAERMRDYFADPGLERRVEDAACTLCMARDGRLCGFGNDDCQLNDETYLPLENVWLGTSIENRRFVHRADVLRETPAAVRFVSAEPLLGPLVNLLWRCGGCSAPIDRDGYVASGHCPRCGARRGIFRLPKVEPELDLTGIDWLIVGGESGPRARPMRVEWARDLRDAAQANGTAFFFKQWGGRTPKAGGRELDGRTWDEMPAAGSSGGGVGVTTQGEAFAGGGADQVAADLRLAVGRAAIRAVVGRRR